MADERCLVRILFFAAAVALAGCTRIETRVMTYLSHESTFPASGEAVAVIAKARPEEPLLEVEVQRKMECLLRNHGLEVKGLDDATYVLLVVFGIETTSTFVTEVHTNQSGTHSTGISKPLNRRWLMANLYDWRRFNTLPEERKNEAIAWRATTNSIGSSEDLRDIIDYMLVATFEHFGEDTGKQVRHRLAERDKRVKSLRAQLAAPTVRDAPG